MLAAMGYIAPEITGMLPGYLSPSAGLKFADIPNRLAVISEVPAGGWGQILAYGGFYELSLDQSAVGPVRWNQGCSGRLRLQCSRLQRSFAASCGF